MNKCKNPYLEQAYITLFTFIHIRQSPRRKSRLCFDCAWQVKKMNKKKKKPHNKS